MRHPRTRAERRHERERIIARRRFIWEVVWAIDDAVYEHSPAYKKESVWGQPFDTWGMYAKYNMGCGCKMCHGAKYFKCKDKRRKALKSAESQAEFRRTDKAVGD